MLQVEINHVTGSRLQHFNVGVATSFVVRFCFELNHHSAHTHPPQLFNIKLHNLERPDHLKAEQTISFNELESTQGGGKVCRVFVAVFSRQSSGPPSPLTEALSEPICRADCHRGFERIHHPLPAGDV